MALNLVRVGLALPPHLSGLPEAAGAQRCFKHRGSDLGSVGCALKAEETKMVAPRCGFGAHTGF